MLGAVKRSTCRTGPNNARKSEDGEKHKAFVDGGKQCSRYNNKDTVHGRVGWAGNR